jgi:hypothetical protein
VVEEQQLGAILPGGDKTGDLLNDEHNEKARNSA